MRKHWKKIVIISVSVLVALVLIAPIIAVKSGYVARLINENSGLNGTIEFESASVNWFTNIQFRDMTIRDESGNTAATIGSLTLSRNLASLLFYGVTEAEVELKDCDISVNREDNELNWIKILREKETSDSDEPLHLMVNLVNANVSFQEEAKTIGELSGLEGFVNFCPVGVEKDEQMIGLHVTTPKGLDIQGTLQLDHAGEFAVAQTTVNAEDTDVSFANPILKHLDLPQLSMKISGRSSLRWNTMADSYTLTTEFENFVVDRLSPDQKQMVHGYPVVPTSINGSINLNSRLPSGFQMTNTYGHISFDGVLPKFEAPYLDADPDSMLRLEASLDLAKFVNEHPDWVQVREGVDLKQGTITLSAFKRNEGSKERVLVDLRADKLLANRGTQTIEWRNPVTFSCAISREELEESVELEFVECKSDFLNIKGSGGVANSGTDGNVEMKGNLASLKQRLDEFFDLGTFQLAGILDGQLSWKSTPASDASSSFQLQTNSTIQDFNFGFSDEDGWHEKLLNLLVTVDCQFVQGSLSEFAKLDAILNIDSDSAKFVLRKPVQFVENYQAIFDAELNGSSKNWMRRVNSLFDSGIEMAGEAGVTAVVSATPKFVRVRSRQFAIRPFRLQVSDLDFNEPIARGQVDLVYERENGSLKANAIQLTSTNFLIETKQFQSIIKDNDRQTTGDFQINGSAQKLSMWFLPDSLLARGTLTGNLELRVDQEGVQWDSKIESEKLGLLQRNVNPKTQKPRLDELIPAGPATLQGSGAYADGKVELGKTTLVATQAEIELAGLIDVSTSKTNLDLTGKLNTDLQELIKLWAPTLSPDVLFSGGRVSNFKIKGALSDQASSALLPAELAGSAQMKWDKGEVFALPIEQGALEVELANSEILIRPKNLKISNGELAVTPKLVFRKEPYSLEIPSGTVIRNAEIGPKVFRTWMRYLTPMLADATEARGRFSIELDKKSALPLSNPLAGNLNGRMSIDSVTVGPGPLGQSLITTLQQVLTIIGKDGKLRSLRDKPWLDMPTQEIKVAVDGGRVAHELLRFKVGEINVFTSGTVDMNQNVDMVVLVPIEPDWFKERPILKSVVGDAIQIPLKGNLSNPKWNLDFLKGLSRRLAVGAAEKFIGEKAGGILNNELLKNKLLKEGGEPGKLGNFLEGKARDLIKKGIFKGLDKLKKKE